MSCSHGYDPDPDSDCCPTCGTNMTKLMKQEAQWLMEYGWFIHYVIDEDDRSPTGYNYHTHGLVDSLNHIDLQIVVGIQQDLAGKVFAAAVDEIKAGKVYQPGMCYPRVIEEMDVAFITAQEGTRDVMRIIFPDATGSLDQESMHPDYAVQYDLVEQDPGD